MGLSSTPTQHAVNFLRHVLDLHTRHGAIMAPTASELNPSPSHDQVTHRAPGVASIAKDARQGDNRTLSSATRVNVGPRCTMPTMTEGPGTRARRHHVVSRFYLEYFANDRDQIRP